MSDYDYEDEEMSEAPSVWPEMSDEAEDFKNKLHEHLAAIESSGTYATSDTLSEFTNPGIAVDGLDILRLPIGVEDVKQIIQRSQQAPFGKDSETIIDTNVRKAWQIDADKINCCNSNWQQYLDKITFQACEKLGVPDPSLVRADLYKMLIYEEGGKFEAHQDTERQEGMFATLIVCLPSQHSGGDVVLEHNNQVITINSSKESMLNASYLAWYADVTHTVKEVTSGYRVALSYNLINQQPQPQTLQSANAMTNRTTQLTQILNSWNGELQQELGQVIVPLDHQYTNMGLSINKLKGRDSHVALEIMSACTGEDEMLVFLGQLERRKIVAEEGGGKDSSLHLDSLYDMRGLKLEIRDETRIDKECLLCNVYQDRTADAQTGGGYMGNWSAQLYEVYHDSVLFLVPGRRFDEWLIGLDNQPQRLLTSWILKYDNRVLRDNNQDCRQAWQRCCCSILNFSASNTLNSKNDAYLGSVASSAIMLDDIDMFNAAVQSVQPTFGLADCRLVGEALNPRNIDIFWNSAEQMLIKSGLIHTSLRNLIAFENGFRALNGDHKEMSGTWDVKPWQSKLTALASKLITSVIHIFPEDPDALIDLLEMREDRPEEQFLLSEDVRGLLLNNLQQGHFITTFARAAFRRSNLSAGTTVQVFRLIQAIIPSLVENFALDAFVIPASPLTAVTPRQTKYLIDHVLPQFPWTRDRETLASTTKLFNCVRQQDKQMLIILFDRIKAQTGILRPEILPETLFALISAMVEHSDIAMQPLTPCVAQLLDVYVAMRCQSEPECPSDWSRPEEVSNSMLKSPMKEEIDTFLQDKDAKILHSKHDLADLSSHWRYKYLKFLPDSTGTITIVQKTCNKWAKQYKEWHDAVLQAKRDLAFNCGPLSRLQKIVPGYDLNTIIPLQKRFLEDEDQQELDWQEIATPWKFNED